MGDSLLPQPIEKVNWWMNHESELQNLKINVVEDDGVESFMENIHEEAPSIEFVVHGRHNSLGGGSDFSYDSPPSYGDVAPQCGSPVSTSLPSWGEQILYSTPHISAATLCKLVALRLEGASFSSSLSPFIIALENLKKLHFIMCEFGDVLMSSNTRSHIILPNLTELVMDWCYDLKELPSYLCNLVQLKTLRITNCQELETLPTELGSLSNLENLRLHCCTKLKEIPESIGSLNKLSFLDISDCSSISILPEEFGELSGLKVLKMSGCRGLQELPMSMIKLWELEEVICDEETTYLWMNFESDLYNLNINVVRAGHKGVQEVLGSRVHSFQGAHKLFKNFYIYKIFKLTSSL